jgi:MSHA biogenesis protein MshQ
VAGSNFDLSASSGVTGGYTGTPAIDETKVVDHNNATIKASTLTGAFGAATGVAATGSSFRYTDVGNIQFQADAVVDTAFAAIDAAAGDCVANSSSNTLTGGRYGCNIGSNASARMGRWYPSHYSFSGSLTPACTAGGFTYMGQDALAVNLVVKAHATTGGTASATDPVVSRLVSGFTGRASVTFSGDNASSPVAITRLVNPGFPVMPSNTLWNEGQVSIADSFAFSKLTTPDGPYDSFRIQAAVADADGSTLIGPTTATGTTSIRYGQLRVGNAYGSELLPLPIPVEARYWNGSAYVLNTLDSCTAFAVSAIQMGSYTENLNNCETQLSPTSSQTLAAGRLSSLQLSKPGKGNSGSVLLTLNVAVTPVASATTCVSATATPATAANMPWFGTNPAARATFGKHRSPLIYLRENY